MSQLEDPNNPFNYPINPDFGNGIFRRRLHLQKGSDEKGNFVFGQVEDCNHGFQSKLYYADNKITAIDAELKRTPFTTCDGAKKPLMALIGSPLGLTAKEQIMLLDPSANCTHWLDLTLLCAQQAYRDEAQRDYQVAIPDEIDQPTLATISCNGEVLLEWSIKEWQILAPAELAGKTLYKGFASWANDVFADEPDLLEAAFILQKGYFVSKARRYDLDKLAGEAASTHTVMRGACYSYSEPMVNIATRTANSTRDFTDAEEQLLQFK